MKGTVYFSAKFIVEAAMKLDTLAIVVSLLLCCVRTDGQTGEHTCQAIDSCSCRFQDDGTVVDITSLGNTDNTPRFKDVKSPDDGFVYSYNPCQSFSEQSCQDAAVCKMDATTGESLTVGMSGSPQFTYDTQTGDTVIAYTAGALANIHTFVYLICDKSAVNAVFYPNGSQAEGNIHLLTIWSVCACPNMCTASGPRTPNSNSSPSTSISLYVVIGLGTAVLLYLVFGTVYMKMIRGAKGKEMLPNLAAWQTLGGLIKDGTKFTFCGCMKRSSYDKL